MAAKNNNPVLPKVIYGKTNPVLKSRRGAVGETWWSKEFIRALERISVSSRLTRGKSYARTGKVSLIQYYPGIVEAQVRGSRSRPYTVTITFEEYSSEDWEKAIDGMAGQAIIAARLLSGDMPDELEGVFKSAGLSLFPKSRKDIITHCSCPDWENPCKHIAAVYYILAEWFDDNPFLLFGLRGMEREEVLEELRKRRGRAFVADEPAETAAVNTVEVPGSEKTDLKTPSQEEYIRNFWKAGSDLDSFEFHFNDSSVPALKQLGESPFKLGGKNLSERLESASFTARKYALKLAGLDKNGERD
ncbi:MAG: SWIM zinc finger family protein [Euryarchaeota archaeon]|nr:SWIM zinc finger family protein [Euryarchaeota archaeon]